MASFVLRTAAFAARLLPSGARRMLYRLGPITVGLRRLLTRAAPVGIAPVRVAGGALTGMQLLLDLKVEKDLWLGTYELGVERALRDLGRPGMTAYDLGANVGYTTMLLARIVGPGGRVVAIEALPSNVERLRAAIGLNGVEGFVAVVPKAVGAANGRGRFLVHPSAGMGRLADGARPTEKSLEGVVVDVVSMDDLVYHQGFPVPDLVKIDLEGGEGAALFGMKRLLRERRPTLLIELHGQAPAEEVWQRLTSAGYLLFDLERDSRPVRGQEDLRPKSHILAEFRDEQP